MTSLQGERWESMIQNVHHSNLLQSSQELDLVTKMKMHKLQKALTQKSKTWWDTEYLRKYLQEGLVPMGLRIQILPQIPELTIALKEKWEKNLNTCSKNMLLMLIEHHEAYIENLDKEIAQICDQLKGLEHNECFKTKDLQIKNIIERLNKELVYKKESKFQRDREAYGQGLAYKWSTYTPIRQKFPRRGGGGYSSSDTATSQDSLRSRKNEGFMKPSRDPQRYKRRQYLTRSVDKDRDKMGNYTTSRNQQDLVNEGHATFLDKEETDRETSDVKEIECIDSSKIIPDVRPKQLGSGQKHRYQK